MAMSCTSPGQTNPKSTVAGQERLEIYDRDSKELWKRILTELRKMTIHLSAITNEQIEILPEE